MEYKFYIRMDGSTYGPYTTKEVMDMDVPDDTEIMEESVKEWHMAKEYPFEDLIAAEKGYIIGDDGTVRHIGTVPTPGGTPTVTTPEGMTIDSNSYSEPVKFGWNWGAFFFGWLWGIFNGVYWTLLMLIPMALSYMWPAASIVTLIVEIFLGIKGSELAWESKKWSSLREFNETQHKWAKAVLWLVIICLGIGIIAGIASSI